MRIGKKLLDVASNFFEIEREEKPSRRLSPVENREMQTAPAEPDIPVATVDAPVEDGAPADQELDAFIRGMDGSGEYAAAGPEHPAPSPVTMEAEITETDDVARIAEPEFGVEDFAAVPEGAVSEDEDSVLMDDLATAISDSGEVDFERIFQSAKLPEAGFTAEQAVNMLHALPENLPIAIKRKTVTATFAALGNPRGAEPDAIRADATGKRESLSVYLDALTSQTEQISRESSDEIARLEAELQFHRERKEESERKHAIAWEACRRQMGLMDEVIVFFNNETEESAVLARSSQAEEETPEYEEGDLPPFLANDTQYRLLGITGEAPSMEQIVEEGGFEVDASALEAQVENAENAEDAENRRSRRRNGAAATTE